MNIRRTRLAGLIAGVAVLLAAPAAAHAGTLSSDGTTATHQGTDAPDSLIVDVSSALAASRSTPMAATTTSARS